MFYSSESRSVRSAAVNENPKKNTAVLVEWIEFYESVLESEQMDCLSCYSVHEQSLDTARCGCTLS
jgi:hypothetical protein